ncbi:hypothetical protein Y1Q_0017504 [Alligator mississippiensis]|uniref:Uncharacterized protein n=1 Tax=Alligator mississippiensis TaxID=8496 RepID=A0A151P269_ALLMI|nr:hypothetical protein Y1Q_0017504 [Alligator mississippiensis]
MPCQNWNVVQMKPWWGKTPRIGEEKDISKHWHYLGVFRVTVAKEMSRWKCIFHWMLLVHEGAHLGTKLKGDAIRNCEKSGFRLWVPTKFSGSRCEVSIISQSNSPS